jgi:hypothetical protein
MACLFGVAPEDAKPARSQASAAFRRRGANWMRGVDNEQFVSCAARRARFHERRGDYKISKLSDKPTERKPTGPRQPRTHEQRVRRKANEVLEEVRRELLELKT